MTVAPGADPVGDELVLEPPAESLTAVERAAGTTRIDDATAERIAVAVNAFVDALAGLEAASPELDRKVAAIHRMGNEEIRRSAAASSRFLDRPTAALRDGALAQGSQISSALLALRQQIEALDPGRHLGARRGLGAVWGRRVPFRSQVGDYFRKYQSAQAQIEAVVAGLYRGQDELLRDNAAIEQEKAQIWATRERLEQYASMAAALDEALTRKIAEIEPRDPEKAKALKEDALFYVRQKRQDVLTQLAVAVQGYLALDLIRRNNLELVKGVERATTTTVSALRTAVIAALALGNQRLVLDQIGALNTTTGNVIASTAQMLRQQTAEIQTQAASATVSIETLQAAFDNVYATVDSIDAFRLAALDTMRASIDALAAEVARAHQYVDRARTAELAQSSADGLVSELSLPVAGGRG